MLLRISRCLLLAWGAMSCFHLGMALAVDAAFFARFERAIGYTTPLPPELFWDVLATFRLGDLVRSWPLAYVLLAFMTLLLLLARNVRRMPVVFLLVAAPQLIVLPIVSAGGSSWWLTGGTLDGEWLHEGWPLTEAAATWVIVPFAICVTAAVRLTRIRADQARRDSAMRMSSVNSLLCAAP